MEVLLKVGFRGFVGQIQVGPSQHFHFHVYVIEGGVFSSQREQGLLHNIRPTAATVSPGGAWYRNPYSRLVVVPSGASASDLAGLRPSASSAAERGRPSDADDLLTGPDAVQEDHQGGRFDEDEDLDWDGEEHGETAGSGEQEASAAPVSALQAPTSHGCVSGYTEPTGNSCSITQCQPGDKCPTVLCGSHDGKKMYCSTEKSSTCQYCSCKVAKAKLITGGSCDEKTVGKGTTTVPVIGHVPVIRYESHTVEGWTYETLTACPLACGCQSGCYDSGGGACKPADKDLGTVCSNPYKCKHAATKSESVCSCKCGD